jgi:hypothetical protein
MLDNQMTVMFNFSPMRDDKLVLKKLADAELPTSTQLTAGSGRRIFLENKMTMLTHIRDQMRSRLKLRERQIAAERANLEQEIDALAKQLNRIIREQSVIAHQLDLLENEPVIHANTKNPVFWMKVRGWQNVVGISRLNCREWIETNEQR